MTRANAVVVAIGSRNPAKTRGTEKAFLRFYRKVVIREVDVSGLVRAQPMNLDETLVGARKRAMAALDSERGADFGVGVEAGIVPLGKEAYEESVDLQVAAIVDPKARLHFGFSSGFPLPSPLIARMRESGQELDAYAHELTGVPKGVKIQEEHGVIYHLSRKNLSRTEMTEQCVSMALLPWVNGEAYGIRERG